MVRRARGAVGSGQRHEPESFGPGFGEHAVPSVEFPRGPPRRDVVIASRDYEGEIPVPQPMRRGERGNLAPRPRRFSGQTGGWTPLTSIRHPPKQNSTDLVRWSERPPAQRCEQGIRKTTRFQPEGGSPEAH